MLRSTKLVTVVPCQLQLAPASGSVRLLNTSTGNGKERSKVSIRRIRKAERDERMDLTAALTPVRSYMGGFTRPTDIRAAKWFPGGDYAMSERPYEEPSAFAYEPHTVFLLESRYDIMYGVGRKDHPAHIVAVCRTADFEDVIQMFNSENPPIECLEYMDNARWPFLKQKGQRQVKWWDSDQERSEVLRDLEEDSPAKKVGQDAVQSALKEASAESEQEELMAKKEFRRHLAQIAAVAARVNEEQKLSDIATEIKQVVGKIPFEHEFEDGTVAHPSGFVPPTPADKQYDPEYHLSPHPHSRVAKELRKRQMETVNEHHSDSLVPRIDQWKALKEKQDTTGSALMPGLTAGFMTGEVKAASTEPRDAKIPTEIHGIHDKGSAQPMQHPSGFVPPTARMARGETDARTSVVRDDSEVPEAPERAPTFSSSDMSQVDEFEPESNTGTEDLPKPPKAGELDVGELRKNYFPLIKDEPFWRPLITLTVSTRPIAKTLARLSRGLSKGIPFYTAVDPDDRKSQASLASRLRSLRVARMRTLATEMAQLLAGARGGPIGVRFDEQSRGRGIDGEGLEEPIPWEKRVIGVGIGEWYPLADELKESFKILGEKEVSEVYGSEQQDPFLIYKVNDQGKPVVGEGEETPEFPWPAMDKMNDSIREGLQASAIVKKLERLLALNKSDPLERCLSVSLDSPPKNLKDLESATLPELHSYVSDPTNPITIRLLKNSDLHAGNAALKSPSVRNALKKRVDNFYSKYSDTIALAETVRSSGVIYPRVEMKGEGSVKSKETYILDEVDARVIEDLGPIEGVVEEEDVEGQKE